MESELCLIWEILYSAWNNLAEAKKANIYLCLILVCCNIMDVFSLLNLGFTSR